MLIKISDFSNGMAHGLEISLACVTRILTTNGNNSYVSKL